VPENFLCAVSNPKSGQKARRNCLKSAGGAGKQQKSYIVTGRFYSKNIPIYTFKNKAAAFP